MQYLVSSKNAAPKKWISLNATGLSTTLKDNVYGQHLAIKAVVRHLNAHFDLTNNEPSKALALSFHGGSGTGKYHISRIIANHVYREGMKSQFVHLIESTVVFPHADLVDMYKDKLRDLIESSVKKCGRSMFVFSETDKMPPGLIDTIKPYLNNRDDINGANYRKAIFLFLSNSASMDITEKTLEIFHEGKDRESIELKDMENIIINSIAKTKTGGLYNSDVMLLQTMTAYIPFLPLERKHVRQCIKSHLLTKKFYKNYDEIMEEDVSNIANQIYYSQDGEGLFSTSGCRRVKDKTKLCHG